MSSQSVEPRRILVAQRSYVLTFEHGASFPLSAMEAQTLVDSYPVTRFQRNAVTLRGDRAVRGDGAGIRSTVRPATLGGGDAFARVTR